ncbi:MAG: metallophosphoesterase [Actinomycetota bacterium]|nr:metallophosphoesterase [Actinomycetota bacterium]
MADETTAHAAGEKQREGHAWRQWRRRAGAAALIVVLGLTGAWLALTLAGTERQAVGPFDTTMALRPALRGGTTVDTPPLGQLMFDTHDSPMRLRVQVRGLDAEKAREIAADPSTLQGLEDRAVADIRAGVFDVFLRTAVVALLGAAGFALLVLRRVRAAFAAGAVALAAIGGGYYATWSTWTPSAVQEPRFSGLLTSAPSLVGNARDIIADFDKYRRQLARLVTNVGSLYSATSTLPVMSPQEDLVRVLHVSDLHIAPQAWDVIRTVAHQYNVDVVVDTGDITDHGSKAENGYLEGVRGIDAPYVWVRGNHDSMITQRAMQRLPGVVVLNGKPRNVAGLRFLGAGDPRFTPDNSEPIAEDSVVAQAHALADVARRDGDVDVMAYHDPEPAAVFDGLTEMVLSGHQHRHDVDRMEHGTWRILEGSTGGSGLRALEPDTGPAPIELSVLYVDKDTAELKAWDHLRLGGLGLASAHIEREIVDPVDEPVIEVETPQPTQPVPSSPLPRPTVTGEFPTPTPTPTATEPEPEPGRPEPPPSPAPPEPSP